MLELNPKNGETAIASAFISNQLHLAGIMMGAYLLKEKDSITKKSAGILLSVLARANQEDWSIKLLQIRSAQTTIDVVTSYYDLETENTALHYAVIHDLRDLFPLLLDLGFDPNQ